MEYESWAKSLIDYFFGAHTAGADVRLMIDREVLDGDQFQELGGFLGFTHAISSGPKILPEGTSIEDAAMLLHAIWKTGNQPVRFAETGMRQDAPLFLPYLTLLALAWTEPTPPGHGPNAYYPRISALPNLEWHGLGTNALRRWMPLWKSLEEWSLKTGSVGNWRLERLGEHAYVGIPKSQVILPPHRQRFLPELFYRCNISPRRNYSQDELRSILLRFPATQQFLGEQLFKLAGDPEEPMGNALWAMLHGFVEEWDGARATRGGQSSGADKKVALRLVLSYRPAKCRWVDLVGVVDEPLEGYRMDAIRASLLRLNPVVLRLANSEGEVGYFDGEYRGENLIPPESYFEPLPTKANENDLFFLEVRADCLVEVDDLQENAPVYFLHPEGLDSRIDSLGLKETSVEIAQGIPGKRLRCFEDSKQIEKCDGLQELLGRKICRTERPSISLTGGSQIRSGTYRRCYLYYDLPLVCCRSNEDPLIGGQLSAEGAELELFNFASDGSDQVGGAQDWFYKVKVEGDSSVVFVRFADGQDESTRSFGVYHDSSSEIARLPVEDFRVCRFGRTSRKPGLRGAVLDPEFIPDSPPELDFVEDPKFGDGNHWNPQDPGVRFMEALAVQGRQFTYSEAADLADRLSDGMGHSTLFWRELSWLRDRAMLDVRTDSMGRLSGVVPAAPALSPVPIRSGDSITLIPTGSWQTGWTEKLIGFCDKAGFACDVAGFPYLLNSVAIKIRVPSWNDAQRLAEEAACDLQEDLPAAILGEWAASWEDWRLDIGSPWLEGDGRHYREERAPLTISYSPYDCRYSLGEFRAPVRLELVHDESLSGLRYNKVVRRRRDPDGFYSANELEHAFVRDPSWVKWRCHSVSSMDLTQPDDNGSGVAVPFDLERNSLYLPENLTLPYVLSRALTLCNGEPPREIAGDLPFEIPKDLTNSGTWLRYDGIPCEIAEIILHKVDAYPQIF